MKERNLESPSHARVVLAANLDIGGGGARRGSELRKINLAELGEAARILPARVRAARILPAPVRAACSPPAKRDGAGFAAKPSHRLLPYFALAVPLPVRTQWLKGQGFSSDEVDEEKKSTK